MTVSKPNPTWDVVKKGLGSIDTPKILGRLAATATMANDKALTRRWLDIFDKEYGDRQAIFSNDEFRLARESLEDPD